MDTPGRGRRKPELQYAVGEGEKTGFISLLEILCYRPAMRVNSGTGDKWIKGRSVSRSSLDVQEMRSPFQRERTVASETQLAARSLTSDRAAIVPRRSHGWDNPDNETFAEQEGFMEYPPPRLRPPPPVLLLNAGRKAWGDRQEAIQCLTGTGEHGVGAGQ